VKGLRLALVIPSAFLAAAIGMRLLVARAPAQVAIDLVQPIAVVTAWHAFGAAMLGILLAALAVATAAYANVLKLGPATASLKSATAIAAMTAFSLACAWCIPALFSSDVYAYAAYGELARLGADPYAHGLLPGGNPIFDAAIVQWGNPPPICVYGPAFVWIAATIVPLAAPFGTAMALDGLRALSSAALLLCVLLAYVAYRGTRGERLAAAATIGLNPVVLWSAAEGHNDGLALAIALAGFACARSGRAGIGAFVAACSGAMKLPGIVAAIPLALLDRRAWIGATAGILTALAVSVPIFRSAVIGLAPHARYAPEASFQAMVRSLALLMFAADGPAAAAAWTLAAAGALACAWAATPMFWRRDPEGWTYLASAGWLLVPNPYPWYAVWLVAIAAVAPRTRGATALLALAFGSLVRYVPDAVGVPPPAASVLLGVAATLPFFLLLSPRRPSAIINGSR
jgi:hypothetical protein